LAWEYSNTNPFIFQPSLERFESGFASSLSRVVAQSTARLGASNVAARLRLRQPSSFNSKSNRNQKSLSDQSPQNPRHAFASAVQKNDQVDEKLLKNELLHRKVSKELIL
jgi:hypothetical protein